MIEDFTALQNIEEPKELKMISGPVSYTKYSVHNNNQLIKEIEIFGDSHRSESGNCTEQGEHCIYVTKEGIIQDKDENGEVNCVDISTYLGYAILDAHENQEYTDIYIESLQQESGRHYDISYDDPMWSAGYIVKSEIFLKPCGTSINRHPLCKSSPNNERNYARVHSGDIRSETSYYDLDSALLVSLDSTNFIYKVIRKRAIKVLDYLLRVTGKLLKAFAEEDLGSAIRQVFLPFYDMIYPGMNKDDQEKYVKLYYPFIDILMNELGGYYNDSDGKMKRYRRNVFNKRETRGSLILKRETNEGRKILTHRIGKTYSKLMNMKNNYEKHELSYIMISAYEKFISGIETQADELIGDVLNRISKVTINSHNKFLLSIREDLKLIITKLFSPLYDIYTIGRLISYPESERIIYYAGYEHCDRFKEYITDYLNPALKKANNLYTYDKNINYSIVKDIEKYSNTYLVNRCMRI